MVDRIPIPPLIQCQSPWWSGGSDPNILSNSFPTSSARRLQSPFNISAMARPNLQMRDWSLAGYRRAETLLSTSLHVVSKINAFFLASLAVGFGTDLRRAAKSLPSLAGVVRGQGGGALEPPEVLILFPQGGAAEAYKDQVMVRVMPGVLDGYIPKYTTIRPLGVICKEPYLPPRPDHAPLPPVLAP